MLGKYILVGVGAGIGLLVVYAGIIAAAQGLDHVVEQTLRLWPWLAALVVGFGIQAGLYAVIRHGIKGHAGATASTATSGGVSAGSMVACCAHHLSDVLPLLGLSGAATLLAEYQGLFLVLGLSSNAIGITMMLETIQRHELCPIVGGWRLDMGKVRVAAITGSVVVLGISAIARF